MCAPWVHVVSRPTPAIIRGGEIGVGSKLLLGCWLFGNTLFLEICNKHNTEDLSKRPKPGFVRPAGSQEGFRWLYKYIIETGRCGPAGGRLIKEILMK
jgi:hypothetical protein